MTTPGEIEAFLQDFHFQMNICGLVMRDERGRTSQTLLDLEITQKQRDEILRSLKPDDYSEGPLPDTLNGQASMWIFTRAINGTQVSIKITMGKNCARMICISFRISEFALQSPKEVKKHNACCRDGESFFKNFES
jgi:hypothetical protein